MIIDNVVKNLTCIAVVDTCTAPKYINYIILPYHNTQIYVPLSVVVLDKTKRDDTKAFVCDPTNGLKASRASKHLYICITGCIYRTIAPDVCCQRWMMVGYGNKYNGLEWRIKDRTQFRAQEERMMMYKFTC